MQKQILYRKPQRKILNFLENHTFEYQTLESLSTPLNRIYLLVVLIHVHTGSCKIQRIFVSEYFWKDNCKGLYLHLLV